MNHQRDRLRKQCCSSCLSFSCFLVNYIKDPIIVYTVVFISLDYNIKKGPASAPWPILFLFCSLLALTYNSRPRTCFHSPLGRQIVAGSLDAVENYNYPLCLRCSLNQENKETNRAKSKKKKDRETLKMNFPVCASPAALFLSVSFWFHYCGGSGGSNNGF